ncbi:polysaccharide deacetylase family protein [Geobacter sp. SVR]|uniref:polysaccharide deacetylase family protein n=1 Tax=Geobacter sp. SVR TaxID=2495594 RepID=UPI00143EFF6B|nr:polysaccharide deacetylase family protein [Geobacter sp. SVR]BCS54306.1 polysaccharide deacetylase [Geobacter sp. SVR]GCF85835.1 polysaccharide deacetylase [Geobacter sp. SVR]
MPDNQIHALTVDVEDWFHVCAGQQPEIPRSAWRVRQATERILTLLDSHGAKATFFMLGCVAEAEPELAPMIERQGHEVASHGWSHRLLHDLTVEEFECELERTEAILLDQTGKRPFGFRAPRWSVSMRTPWVDAVLVRRGYLYDSSRNPLPFLAGSGSALHPSRVRAGAGELWEVPPMVTPMPLFNLPTGGGWGFRLFPFRMIAATVARYHDVKQPAVLYLHPREVDPESPRVKLHPLRSFATYGPRSDAAGRIAALLERFRFTTLLDLVESWQPVS